MQRIALATATIVLFSSSLFANLDIYEIEDLVWDSNLIVIGTLEVTTEDEQGFGNGFIELHEVLSGRAISRTGVNLEVGDRIRLEWSNGGPYAFRLHDYRSLKKGVWLLTVDPNGNARADEFHRFWPLDEATQVTQLARAETAKPTVLLQFDPNPRPSNAHGVSTPELKFSGSTTNLEDHAVFRAIATFLVFLGSFLILYRKRYGFLGHEPLVSISDGL